jgi:hypothetical protein
MQSVPIFLQLCAMAEWLTHIHVSKMHSLSIFSITAPWPPALDMRLEASQRSMSTLQLRLKLKFQ